MSSRSSSSDEDAGVISDHSEGEIRSRSSSPETKPERKSRERERAPIDSSSCLSKYYRERFGSHSPEDYLNLRFSKMNPKLSKEEIKHILDDELQKLAPFEVKVVRDPETDDRLAYVNFRRNNCAKTVRRALIPKLQDRLGENVLIDPAGVLRDQEGKFIPDRFNRAQMSDGHGDNRHNHHNNHQNNNKSFSNLNQDPNLATRTLFVGNLPGDIRHHELVKSFGHFGSVEDIDIKVVSDGSAAYAFIVFHSLDAAIEALESQHNRALRNGSTRCQIGYGKSQVSPKLWVGRLGAWASKDMLIKEFDRYGVVESVDFKPGDHHAYVRFSDSNSARDACLALKNYPLDGRHKIVVDYAKERVGQKKFDRNDRQDSRKRVSTRSPDDFKKKRKEKSKSRTKSPSPFPTIGSYEELNEKHPSTWKGFFCLKKTEYNIKLHRVSGKENMVQDLMRNEEGGAIKLKVEQRLPRETVFLDKLKDMERDSLVFMVGAEVSMSFTPFIQYMNEKNASGI
ncbi:unnamed protein product [Bursaphelenchus xylophilus]|uniref:(pine wood nematode) hypothetical protein n=1 Tax=Bursaphelenchus xylophilus TaxID=6326 RepID=A0A1I7S2W8_BURXY|nr:unnamed protein product [Bursaphelenchus xylophilus]CAG9116011.1 unnamed protein product [Bursaphelenchus xylophilus]